MYLISKKRAMDIRKDLASTGQLGELEKHGEPVVPNLSESSPSSSASIPAGNENQNQTIRLKRSRKMTLGKIKSKRAVLITAGLVTLTFICLAALGAFERREGFYAEIWLGRSFVDLRKDKSAVARIAGVRGDSNQYQWHEQGDTIRLSPNGGGSPVLLRVESGDLVTGEWRFRKYTGEPVVRLPN